MKIKIEFDELLTLREFEKVSKRAYIKQILALFNGNKTKAAAALKSKSRHTIYRYL